MTAQKKLLITAFLLFSNFILLAQTKLPFESSPISTQALFKSTLEKYKIPFKDSKNIFYQSEKGKNDETTGYDAFNCSQLNFNHKLFFRTYTEWNSNYDITTNDVDLQLFFLYKDFQSSDFKSRMPQSLKNAMAKCTTPNNIKPNDVISFTISFSIQIGGTSDETFKVNYILFSSKKMFDNDCENNDLDDDEIKDYKKKLNQLLKL
jgi:hypothetical protein